MACKMVIKPLYCRLSVVMTKQSEQHRLLLKERNAAIIDIYKRHYPTLSELSSVFGMSLTNLQLILRNAKIKIVRGFTVVDEMARLEDNYSNKELAEKLGVSIHKITKLRHGKTRAAKPLYDAIKRLINS
jgi:DNA-binding Xre family transcriptional regulator